MNTITYRPITADNFTKNSLDDFQRHQVVKERWRKNSEGQYVLVPEDYVYAWDLDRRRESARKVLHIISENGFAYGAFCGEKIAGYILVSNDRFGSRQQYADLLLFYVSEPYRGLGIGKKLFHLARETAKQSGAVKLYISANSSKESQAAYRRLGCVEALEISEAHAAREPDDVQMECTL